MCGDIDCDKTRDLIVIDRDDRDDADDDDADRTQLGFFVRM